MGLFRRSASPVSSQAKETGYVPSTMIFGTASFILAVAAVSFYVSFTALQDLHRPIGLPEHRSWAIPVMIDGTLIMAAGAGVLFSRMGISTRGPRVALYVFTAISVWTNCNHSWVVSEGLPIPERILGLVGAGSAPIAVLVGTEHLFKILDRFTATPSQAVLLRRRRRELKHLRRSVEMDQKEAEIRASIPAPVVAERPVERQKASRPKTTRPVPVPGPVQAVSSQEAPATPPAVSERPTVAAATSVRDEVRDAVPDDRPRISREEKEAMLLPYLEMDPRPVLSQIEAETGISRATAHRLLKELETSRPSHEVLTEPVQDQVDVG